MVNDRMLERIVVALERLALAQERVADHLDKQAQQDAGFREAIDSLAKAAEIPGPVDSPADQPSSNGTKPMENQETPHVVDWFIDTRRKDRPLMVRLSNGDIREPTPKEAERLG